MMPSAKTEAKMFGSNLYWEEEHLETSLHGGSEPGLLDPPPWELEGKNSSTTLPLDLDLSLDLAKKLLLADQTMGLESSYQSQGSGGAANSASNPRYVQLSATPTFASFSL